MKIEVDDEIVCEIVRQELLELYAHVEDGCYEIDEDTATFKDAISLVLKQYMIPSEYRKWAWEKNT